MTGDELFIRAGEELASQRIGQALQLYQLAEEAQHDPDPCAAGRWNCYMLAGEFERAWCESDAIIRRGKPDPHRFWNGEPFTGRRVMLRCLHGLGDTLQFIRYAALIRRVAQSLTIEAQPKLKALLAQAEIADRVITWREPEPPWDQQIEVMELPYIFRTTIDSIPRHVPYISVESQSSVRPDETSRSLGVGVVWTSSRFNPARSIPIQTMAMLFQTPGVSFFSLQPGEEGAEAEPWAEQIAALPEESSGILETAQKIKTLDLVISVDTMTAHLAGAMGTPVWTLLPFECDWRWMTARLDSPWYPTMQLFRQPANNDWNSVIQEVQGELTALVYRYSPAGRVVAPAAETLLVPER